MLFLCVSQVAAVHHNMIFLLVCNVDKTSSPVSSWKVESRHIAVVVQKMVLLKDVPCFSVNGLEIRYRPIKYSESVRDGWSSEGVDCIDAVLAVETRLHDLLQPLSLIHI